MIEDDEPHFDEADVFEPKRRDRKIDEAKRVIMAEFFSASAERVFYGRQLEIWLESRFFHWITKKALNELAGERNIKMLNEQRGDAVAHMYVPRRLRYPRRQIAIILNLIEEFSQPTFTRALGHHGELLADSALAYTGFRIRSTNVRAVGGVEWTETKHDLDRLIERDGVRYGVEIKNRLGYIDQTEFQIKLRMCAHFGVRPMFVARMMPKSYIFEVQRKGGFCLVLQNQHYPLLATDMAARVRAELKLPVRSIASLPDTTFARFENWHEKSLNPGLSKGGKA